MCLQDAHGVPDALGAPLAYRPQGQDALDVERVQLVGVRQGLEQLVRALCQPSSIHYRIDQLTTLVLLVDAHHQLWICNGCLNSFYRDNSAFLNSTGLM